MSFDLSRNGEVLFNSNITNWPRLLRLAQVYGWKPMGTVDSQVMSEEEYARQPWDGSYHTNDHQIVQTEDAKNLADALEKALSDVKEKAPKHHLHAGQSTEIKACKDYSELEALLKKALLTAAHWEQLDEHETVMYWGGSKQYLRYFIRFCRKGEFSIS